MAAIAGACVATAVLLCGPNVVPLLTVVCFDGLAAAAWVGGAMALGDVVLRAGGVRPAGPLRVASAGGVGLGIFSLAGLGLGLLGTLNRPVAIAFPALGYVLLVGDLVRRGVTRAWGRDGVVAWLRGPAGAMWLWAIPAASLTMSAVAASVLPGVLWRDSGDPHPYDVTSYHLQVPREWYEAGRVVPLRHNMFSYFPMNAEVQSLLLMHAAGGPRGPWTAMYACQFVSVGYTLLMVLAVAGAVGGGPGSSEYLAGGAGAGDRGGGGVGCAVGRHAGRRGVRGGGADVLHGARRRVGVAGDRRRAVRRDPLLVAGVMAGLACGVKITAVPMLLAAVPVAVVAAVGRSMPWRRLAVGCAAFVVAGAVVVGPWLVRNAAWAGNPLWPVGMSVLGRDHFSAGQVERFRVAHSPPPAAAGGRPGWACCGGTCWPTGSTGTCCCRRRRSRRPRGGGTGPRGCWW